MQSAATAPRGDRSQPARRVPTCRGRCARVEPPPAPSASRTARPDGRTSDRTIRVWLPAPFVARGCSRAARTEARARRVTRRRPETRRAIRDLPVAGQERQPSAKPPASDLAAASPAGFTPFHAGSRRAAPPAGLPRTTRKEGRACTVLQPLRRALHRSPEARQDSRGRGWSARLVLPGSGRRPGSGVSGETRAREACLRRRSQPQKASPGGPGPDGPKTDRDARRVAASTRGTLVFRRTLRCDGVRRVPRAKE
jgi:hypothetical protein